MNEVIIKEEGVRLNSLNPLVSIIIPAYNVENYIKECLNSVVSQTYSNIEVLIIDDGSTDDSPRILTAYEQKYKNIKVILEKHNKGQSVARNIGLKKAKGQYILFVDSDDYINRDTVEKLVDLLLRYEVDFVRFNAKSFSSDGEFIKEKEYNFDKYLKEDTIYNKKNFVNIYLSFSPSPVLYMFKSSLINTFDLEFLENIIHEDEWFSTMLFLYSDECVYYNEPFYNRRYRKGSTMTKNSLSQKEFSFNSYITIIKKYTDLINSNVLNHKQKWFLKYRINSIYIVLLNSDLAETYKNERLKTIKSRKIYFSKIYKNYIRIKKAIYIIRNKNLKVF